MTLANPILSEGLSVSKELAGTLGNIGTTARLCMENMRKSWGTLAASHYGMEEWIPILGPAGARVFGIGPRPNRRIVRRPFMDPIRPEAKKTCSMHVPCIAQKVHIYNYWGIRPQNTIL